VMPTVLKVDNAYDALTTIDVGHSADLDLLLPNALNDPTTPAVYPNQEPEDWGGTARKVVVSIGGGPAAGSGTVYVVYAVPLS
jgi:hypothetical protein